MKNKKKSLGFTLIELLMVIAIIGILAGILIPTVGAVRKQANIAASKSQLSNYVTAMQMFKGEYGFFPTFGESSETVELSLESKAEEFMETLSARDSSGERSSGEDDVNRRQIAFHSFSESEFFANPDGTIDDTKLADRFNNRNIKIVIDANSDGVVDPSPLSSELDVPENGIRTDITAYVDEGEEEDDPVYSLWQ